MIRDRQFSKTPREGIHHRVRIDLSQSAIVTTLTGTMFGAWTLLATVIRLTCAFDLHNPAVYRLTVFSFFLALGMYAAGVSAASLIHFSYGHQYLVKRSIPFTYLAPSLTVACKSFASIPAQTGPDVAT